MTPHSPDELDSMDCVCKWSNCGSTFHSLDDLVSHLTSFHVTSQQGAFFCLWEGCQRTKGFNARYKMLIHIRTHTNERPYACPECEKRFSRQENLRIHSRTHTGEKPYVCTVSGCGKAYSNSSDRFKHTRTHFVDKPYECRFPDCGKRYTDPSSLRKHVKIYGHSAGVSTQTVTSPEPDMMEPCVGSTDDEVDQSPTSRRSSQSRSPLLVVSDLASNMAAATRLMESREALAIPFLQSARLAPWVPLAMAYQTGLLLRDSGFFGTGNWPMVEEPEDIIDSDLSQCHLPLDLSIDKKSH